VICRLTSASLVFAVAALAFSVSPASHAQSKRFLVSQEIDNKDLVTLPRNTRSEAIERNDRGPVSADLQLDHLILALQRPAELEEQLTKFIDDLNDAGSPSFHKWLSAEEFGEKFGPAQDDIETVKGWLESQGLTVNLTYSNKMFIDFSGNAGQVGRAFHTELRNYEVNGEMHIANSSDPKVPAALAPVIRGVLYLNNFLPKPMLQQRHQAHIDPKSGRPVSKYTTASDGIPLVPWDLAKIYNIAPLLSAGISGQGMKIVVVEDTNQWGCNGNVALSNAAGGTPCNATSDWAVFRNTFGLGRYTAGSLLEENPGTTVSTACTSPTTARGYPAGSGINSDDVEATIDVEWATAAAPSATIINAACKSPGGGFGGLTAIMNILNHPNADHVDVISMSYGESEESTSAALNASFNTTFQQASTAGVAIFVSSGDEDAASTDGGGADCTGFPPADNGYYGCAVHGITISGWMSSPYDVSVGGLDFADTYLHENGTYWNAANNVFYGSAKSYIPEQPWNDSCAGTLITSFLGFGQSYGPSGFCNSTTASDPSDPASNYLIAVGGSGGPSTCATGRPTTSGVDNGTCVGYAKPTYQSAYIGSMAGLQSDGVRDTPDVSLMAANGLWGHYYLVCYSDTTADGLANGGTACTGKPDTWPGYGGTSVSSPIFAAIQALVVQHKGSLQGLPNPRYYQLAATEYGPTGSSTCNSTNGATSGGSCIFHDVTLGDNIANCQKDGSTAFDCYLDGGNVGVLSTSNSSYQPAYLTTTGWDFATGIGSVNAYNLVMAY